MKADVALSAVEVAEMLHVSKNTVYELIRRGEINSYKVGRKIRFTKQDVDNYIARSRHEKQTAPVSQVSVESSLLNGMDDRGPGFIISGQDVVLDILSNYLCHYGVRTLRAYLGSFESILSLYQDQVQVATSHLWESDTGEYNREYVRRMMPGTHAVLINLTYRKQGFYVKKGNPKKIRTWKDLTRPDVIFLNRRKGSGSRILLDEKMMQLDISSKSINGYRNEIGSHLTLANAIAQGDADVGIGTERVCRQNDQLEFVPLQVERYDMIVKKELMDTPEMQTLLQVLNSREFRKEISVISGNDYKDMGKIVAEV